MCRIASLFLLQRLKGSMSGDACDFNNIENQAVIKFFFLQGKSPKEIHANLKGTLGHHRMPPPKIEWPSLNVVIFPSVMGLVLDDPKKSPPRKLLNKFMS
jgi:hypothetical protein